MGNTQRTGRGLGCGRGRGCGRRLVQWLFLCRRPVERRLERHAAGVSPPFQPLQQLAASLCPQPPFLKQPPSAESIQPVNTPPCHEQVLDWKPFRKAMLVFITALATCLRGFACHLIRSRGLI